MWTQPSTRWHNFPIVVLRFFIVVAVRLWLFQYVKHAHTCTRALARVEGHRYTESAPHDVGWNGEGGQYTGIRVLPRIFAISIYVLVISWFGFDRLKNGRISYYGQWGIASIICHVPCNVTFFFFVCSLLFFNLSYRDNPSIKYEREYLPLDRMEYIDDE